MTPSERFAATRALSGVGKVAGRRKVMGAMWLVSKALPRAVVAGTAAAVGYKIATGNKKRFDELNDKLRQAR